MKRHPQSAGAQSGQDTDAAGEPMFARFSEAYPNIELHVLVTNKFVNLAERDADIAIRLTNTPLDTLIGVKLATVASAVYGASDYCARVQAGTAGEKWLGIECCGFHISWTKEACPDKNHNFYVDDTLLTLAALKAGAGLAYLPCFMGDSEPSLRRFHPPESQHDLGLWLVYHRDLRRIKRVRLFREHMQREILQLRALFEGQLALD